MGCRCLDVSAGADEKAGSRAMPIVIYHIPDCGTSRDTMWGVLSA
jgi:hypothetical protein